MNTKELAKRWLRINHPGLISKTLRVSKYYPEKDIWFFTFPCNYFDFSKAGNLNILLQQKENSEQFYLLNVPYSFLRENKEKFDIRSSGKKFDLHISAKKRNWLECERSKGVSFVSYFQ
jgi:hypothetical protein